MLLHADSKDTDQESKFLCPSVCLSTIHVDPSIKVCFPAAMIAVSLQSHTCHKLWTEICEIRQIFK